MKRKALLWFKVRRTLHSLWLLPKFFGHRYKHDKVFQLRVDLLLLAAATIVLLFKYWQCKGQ